MRCAILLKNTLGKEYYFVKLEPAIRSASDLVIAYLVSSISQASNGAFSSYLHWVASLGEKSGKICEHTSILIGKIIKFQIKRAMSELPDDCQEEQRESVRVLAKQSTLKLLE